MADHDHTDIRRRVDILERDTAELSARITRLEEAFNDLATIVRSLTERLQPVKDRGTVLD